MSVLKLTESKILMFRRGRNYTKVEIIDEILSLKSKINV